MNYIGSKRKLASKILPHVQRAIKTTGFSLYLEPFVGGANVIDKVTAPYKIGADNQKYLVALLTAAGRRECIPDTITRKEYETVRDAREMYPDWYVGLVGFCASYRSKFFGGYANGVHTQSGKIRNYIDESIRTLKRQQEALTGIPFICCDYREWQNIKDAVIYCDPPYQGTTQYSAEKFDSTTFFDWCRIVGQNNILIISEYEAPEDFIKMETFPMRSRLGLGQTEKREENIFTTGIGCEIWTEL